MRFSCLRREKHLFPSLINSRRKKSFLTRRRLVLEPLELRELFAVDATLELGPPSIIGNTAQFSVALDFQATAGEKLAYFGLDVEPSSPELVLPGPDYSAFAFAKSTPLLDGWTQIGFFNDPNFESSVEFDDSLVAPLETGIYTLGTLTVDFGAAGLGLDDAFTVAINGSGTVIGVDDPGQGFVFETVAFNPAARLVAPVSLSGAATVDEGALYTLTVGLPRNLDGNVLVDWGDGQATTVDVADLPSSGELTHIFTDGDRSVTIDVDLETSTGIQLPVGQLDVSVKDVAPTVVITGVSEIDAGSPYTLTIGSVSDPGTDTVTQYIINWGDGQQETIDSANLPENRQVTHVFATGPASPTVTVDIVNEDGSHRAAGTLTLTVRQVPAPEIVITGGGTAQVGAPYILTISTPTGPGSELVAEYFVDWGDSTVLSVDSEDVPPNREFVHTYVDGPRTVLIAIDLRDASGTTLAHFEKSIEIKVVDTGSIILDEFTNSGTIPGETPQSELVEVIGRFHDPDPSHTHTAVIDWGDGSQPEPATVTETDGVGTVTADHQYPTGGVFTIRLEIRNETGTTVDGETRAFVTGLRSINGTLQIVGSDGNDIITVTPQVDAEIFVDMTLPPAGNFRRTYDLASIQRIDIYVGGGNDRVMVSERLDIATYMEGGPGHDRLQAGSGPNMLLGGPGDDMILGGSGPDVLIGGGGRNQLLGYDGDNMLIGGLWEDSNDLRVEVFQIWRSSNSLADRQAAISELIDVDSDTEPDALFGEDGRSVYFASAPDVVTAGNDAAILIPEAIARELAHNHIRWNGIYTVVIDSIAFNATADRTSAAILSAEAEDQSALEEASSKSFDVNGDGYTTPLDVVIVINHLNEQSSGSGEAGDCETQLRHAERACFISKFQLDVNRDGLVTPFDALAIINYLSASALPAEGENDSSGSESGKSQNSVAYTAEEQDNGMPLIEAAFAGNFTIQPPTETEDWQELLTDIATDLLAETSQQCDQIQEMKNPELGGRCA